MPESQEDKDVDALIADMQSTLDKLKAAQRKDVEDEDSEESGEQPRNLRQAERVAFVRVRAHNRRARQARSEANSGRPDADDRVK